MPERFEQIAIDGPAASGKSTVARMVAEALGAFYVNSGEMYRTLTWAALQRGIDPERQPAKVPALLPELDLRYERDGHGRSVLTLNGKPVPSSEIRAPGVAAKVGYLARIGEVREWLRDRQLACRELGLIVMEGRDIGTVVLPDARHKFFLTASPTERARRRLAQGGETVDGATLASVAAEIAQRDELDRNRPIAPLREAPDAVIVDSTGQTIDQVIAKILGTIHERWEKERDR